LEGGVIVSSAELRAEQVHDIRRAYDFVLNPANAVDNQCKHVHRYRRERNHDDATLLENLEEGLVLVLWRCGLLSLLGRSGLFRRGGGFLCLRAEDQRKESEQSGKSGGANNGGDGSRVGY
jgi:hypothetical protein